MEELRWVEAGVQNRSRAEEEPLEQPLEEGVIVAVELLGLPCIDYNILVQSESLHHMLTGSKGQIDGELGVGRKHLRR